MIRNYRQVLISTLTFLGGIYFFLEFILPKTLPESLGGYEFGKYHTEISRGFIAIGAVTFGLGIINLLYVHGVKILFKRKGAVNSYALLGSMILMIAITAYEWFSFEKVNSASNQLRVLASFATQISADKEQEIDSAPKSLERAKILLAALNPELEQVESLVVNRDDSIPKIYYQDLEEKQKATDAAVVKLKDAISAETISKENFQELSQSINSLAAVKQKIGRLSYEKSRVKAIYDFLYEGFFIPLGSAMFSLLGFYIISAGYRAFRVKSAESALMMVAAVVVMLGQIPFYIWIHDSLPEIRLWLLEVPSAAAFRAIKFGAAIAGLYMAIRMWFSIETTSFVEEQ